MSVLCCWSIVIHGACSPLLTLAPPVIYAAVFQSIWLTSRGEKVLETGEIFTGKSLSIQGIKTRGLVRWRVASFPKAKAKAKGHACSLCRKAKSHPDACSE